MWLSFGSTLKDISVKKINLLQSQIYIFLFTFLFTTTDKCFEECKLKFFNKVLLNTKKKGGGERKEKKKKERKKRKYFEKLNTWNIFF